jgi:hypothetical protein
MKASSALCSLTGLATLMVVAGNTAANAACENLVAAFGRAVAANSIEAANQTYGDIAYDPLCGDRAAEFQGKLVEFLVARAGAANATATDR